MVPEFHAPMQVRLGFSRTRRDFMGEQEEVYEVGPRHFVSLFLNDARPFPSTRCAVTSHARLETAAGVSCALSAQPAGAPPGPPAHTDLAPCDHVPAAWGQRQPVGDTREQAAAACGHASSCLPAGLRMHPPCPGARVRRRLSCSVASACAASL